MASSRFDSRVGRSARGLTGLVVALVMTVFGASDIAAQNTGTVTGLVRDAVTLSPLAGAQVSIGDTGLGGLVNNVGRFLVLNVPAGQHTMTVQLIGYGESSQTVTVAAGQTATVDFTLREQALSLEGVIVTGTAGQARRREVGNQISAVSSGDIELAAVTDMGDVLQGRVTGIQINDHAGQIGAGSQIRIRGNNSLEQGDEPLIYVDGIRIENTALGGDDEAGSEASALDFINPADIERIEVVKGPAATTLYGTEASGGVIQIFTKRGAAGAPAWTLSVDQGLRVMPHQGPHGKGSDFDDIYMLDPNEEVNPTGLNLNDCRHEPGCPSSGTWFQNGHAQTYNLSVRGGGETATYFVSGRWSRAEGVVDPQGADDYSVRANISFQPFDGMDISLNNSYTRRNITWIPDGNNAGGFLLNVLRGDAGYTTDNDDSLVLENDVQQQYNSWITSASIGWTPSSSLSHRVNVGMDYTFFDYQDFKPWGFYANPGGSRQNQAETDRNLTLDYNGSFRYDLTGALSSNFSWGGQLYEEFSWDLEGEDEEFAGPGIALVGDGTLQDSDEGRQTLRSGGFFLQEVLGFQDRFFLTGGVRWDGFSTFGEGFGLAAYPKISAAYTVSDEAFWPLPFIETMKLRGAWGKSGRAPGAFDAQRVYEATSADEGVPAVIIDNLGNDQLGPEVSTELEAGFEASALSGRVGLEFTWYDQSTTDAIIGVAEAPSLGTEQETDFNLGEVKNWGTETFLTVIPVRTDNLEWEIGVGYTTNDSEIADLGPLEDVGSSLTLGFPLRIYYGDILQNPDVVGVLPEYEDGMVGRLFPTDIVSLNTRFTLNQALTLDLLGEGQYGHVRSVGPAYQGVRREAWPTCYGIQEVWNANDVGGLTDEEIAAASGLTSTQIGLCTVDHSRQGMWTPKVDFFRLRSATLAYRLPEGWVPGTRSAQVALQAKNLLTFTDYPGLDPEANDNGFSDRTPNEYYTLGQPRVIMISVTVNF